MPNTTIQESKYRRVFRSFRDETIKTDYDVIVNMKPNLRRATAIKSTQNNDGSESSDFAVVVEDESKHFVTCEFWHGSKTKQEGKVVSESNRVYVGQPDYEIGHLFISEIYDNALNCFNNTLAIAQINTKILDFVEMQQIKKQSKLD